MLGDIHDWLGKIDWGSFPAYFGAIALVLTTMTIRRDHFANRRKQADQVAAWTEKVDDGWRIKVKNASTLPVTNICIGLGGVRRGGGIRLSKYDQAELTGNAKPRYISVIGPDTTQDLPYARGPVTVLSLEFMDASGQSWRRDKSGNLVRVPAARSLRGRARRVWRRLRNRVRSAFRKRFRAGRTAGQTSA